MKPYRKHLKRYEDLLTTYEETRAGFVALALEKSRRATPFVAESRALKVLACQASKPQDLKYMGSIRPAVITAAGISDKAIKHLLPEDITNAIQNLIDKYLEPVGSDFVEELVYRFLLTRGDTLGGSMRNVAGYLGECRFSRAVIASLSVMGSGYQWLDRRTNKWVKSSDDDVDIEFDLKGLSWSLRGRNRTMLYNRTVRIVGKNIDLILLNCSSDNFNKTVFAEPKNFIALGELKGGIDPAGADEHWKTARSSLDRIRIAFSKKGVNPHTFFIGAAIENSMAVEIWQQLKDGTLSNAVNMTVSDQLASISEWLCNL